MVKSKFWILLKSIGSKVQSKCAMTKKIIITRVIELLIKLVNIH